MTLKINRRDALKGTGALTISILSPGRQARAGVAMRQTRFPLKPDQLATYLSINRDGSVVGWVGKVDMGQGTEIGWIKMIAEELDLPTDRVSVVQGNSDVTINMGGASGSTGIWKGGVSLRNAAAEARAILMQLASERLDVPTARLSVTDGIIHDSDDAGRRISYGELVDGRHFDAQLEWNKLMGLDLLVKGKAAPKSPSAYRTVGKPGTRRRDIPGKVLGTFEYMVDVRPPGMVHGRMIRPPVAGAVPVAVDESSVRHISGVQIVWEKGFLGLVAPKEWDAIRAAHDLKVTWSGAKPSFPGHAAIYDHIRNAPVLKHDEEMNRGDVKAAFASADRVVEVTYEWPFQTHACMAPACGVADVREDSATVWTGGQKAHFCAQGVATMFKLPRDKVRAVQMTGPGSYGRNDSGDATMDAAVLSKAVGKPVRVQGMRHEGHGWGPKAPASIHVSRAAIDKDGNVTAWQFTTKAFSKRNLATNEGSPEQTLAGQLLGWPLKATDVFGPPDEHYVFSSILKASDTIAPLLDRASPMRTSHMRAPGGTQLNFAVESFMDELALATNMDAVAFRLKHLKDPRDIAVIKRVSEMCGWQPHVGPRRQARDNVYVGRGLSYATRHGLRVAMVAEIEINKTTGKIWPRRFFVAHDCGQIIAPDHLRLTIEGNVVQSASRALYEEVLFDQNAVTSLDWQSYPILDMTDAPESINIDLIDYPDLPPTGGSGEGATRTTAGAIANAIFDATGLRLRQGPFTPERIIKAGFA